ncbi:MAG: hypothetical protein ACPG5T_00700 [Endozoicomonas sp.]
MEQVGQSGSTGQVGYNTSTDGAGRARASDKVAAGDLEGENIRFAGKEASSHALRGQQPSGPNLDPPRDLAPTQVESASAQMGALGKVTDTAMANSKALLQNIVQGTVTPAESVKLQQYASSLSGVADYADALQGNVANSLQGKRSVLAGMGFNSTQLDALLSLAHPDDAGNSLASRHGGQAELQEKKSALSSLGFSDSQIDVLLSLANSDEDGSGLASLNQAGNNPKAVLEALGFKGGQAERLLALSNGVPGNSEQRQLLAQMGFSEAEVDVLLSASDPDMLSQQQSIMRSIDQQTAPYLKGVSMGYDLLSAGNIFDDVILEQLVDIFTVMELLHEQSVNQRRSSREFRAIEYEGAKEEVLNQAAEMKEAAMSNAIAGWVSAGTKIAGGMVQGGMAFRSPPPNMNANQQAAWTQQTTMRGQAMSQLITAGGDMVKAGFEYKGAMHSAKVKEHEAFQKAHDNAAQSETEFMNMHQDMVKTVQSKMDEIIRSWFETLKSTTRG